MYNQQPQMNNYYPYGGYQQAQYMRPTPMEIQQVPVIQTQSQAQNYLKGRPVVSVEEARAAQIDLDGSLFVFTDIGNKKIYTKQLTIDGTPAFNTYELVQPMQQPVPPEYVTKKEFDAVVGELTEMRNIVAALQEQLQKAQAINTQTAAQSMNF